MSAEPPAPGSLPPPLSSGGAAAASGARSPAQPQHGTALWWTGPRTPELRTESPRPPAADEVVVQAVASGISAGTEMLVYRGQVPPALLLDLPTLAGSFRYPVKYGYASVGRVTAVGTAVDDREIGRASCRERV